MKTDWTPPAPGPWQQDQAHMPVAGTAVMQEVYPDGFNRGFTETFARYGLLLDRLAMASVNGFTYHQPQSFDMPGPDGPPTEEQIGAEIARRAAVAGETFATRRWRGDLEEWDAVWKPNAITRHLELGSVDLESLDDAELAEHVRSVGAHLSQMVYQHHRFNMAAMLPVGDFALQAAGWTGRDPASMLRALDGYSPVSGASADELRPVVEAIRGDEEYEALVRGEGDPAARLAELRRRVPAVDLHVRSTGFRIIEGFDVVAPTQLERPELILGRYAAALDARSDEARRRADAFAAEVRAEVPEQHRAEFDELLGDARANYRLRDERGIYSDISAIGLLRWAMLEAGRRLAAAGRLQDPEHALDLDTAELTGLLLGAGAPTPEEAADRQRRRLALTAEGAPRYLGTPPPAPPPLDLLPPLLARMMSSMGFLIEGVLGQLDIAEGDSSLVRGIPVSGGVAEGPARVIRHIDDLDRIQPGDILVTPATGEAFNAMLHLVNGIVTDHGSYACHAGIISREMGIPSVVGTVDASRRIPDGAWVRVDGTAGEVTVRS